MLSNEDVVRQLYAAAEGGDVDPDRIAALFTDDGYMCDMATQTTFRGRAIGECILGLLEAFPDLRRELLQVRSVDDMVVVELAMRGTHTGALPQPSGELAATGRTIDVPSCDVFRLKAGRIASFHCYNEASVMQRQLGAG
jgi:ketosteroid isomerase-like protein